MPALIKNGTVYGGGGGNSTDIECTVAEYNQWKAQGLIKEDVNYFVKDGSSGGGGGVDPSVQTAITALQQGKYDKTGGTITGDVVINRSNGTAGTQGTTTLTVGNDKSATQAQNSSGTIRLYGNSSTTGTETTVAYVDLSTTTMGTTSRQINLPDANGTVILDSDVQNTLVSTATNKPLSAAQGKALNEGKVDKVDGKGLSTVDFTDANYVHTDNNYTNDEKSSVATISNKVDRVEGKGLSTNDFTDAYKTEADKVPQLRTDTDSLILAEKVENGQRASLSVLGYSCPKLSDTVYDYVSDNVLHKKVGRVDLGSLSWATLGANTFYTLLGTFKTNGVVVNSKYSVSVASSNSAMINGADKTLYVKTGADNGQITIKDTSYSSPSDLKSSLVGTYLYYELSTEQTYSVLDNNALDSVGTCTNLLKPNKDSQVVGEITVTRNADDTFTLSGTASENRYITLWNGTITKSGMKLVGCPSGANGNYYMYCFNADASKSYTDNGNGVVLEDSCRNVIVCVKAGKTVNATFKPMLTTNLSAQYSDYVPFTGTSGRLNSDVAELNNCILGKRAWILKRTFTNIAVNSAWGSVYESAEQTFDYSELGLSSEPSFVSLSVNTNSGCWLEEGKKSSNNTKFYIIRPAMTSGITFTVSILIIE